MTELFIAAEGQIVPAGPTRTFFRALEDETAHWLDTYESAALRCCTRLADWRGHCQLTASTLRIDPAMAAAVLQRLRERGLLVAIDQRVPSPTPMLERIPEPVIAIRTYLRPEPLRRLLASAVADEARLGVRRRYLVLDDADATEGDHATRVIVEDFRRAGLDIGLFDEPRRRDLLATPACRAGGDALRVALGTELGRVATGARVWNWALLLSAGASVSFIDDDTAFPVRLPEQQVWHWSATSSHVAEGRFFDDGVPDLPLMARDPFDYLREIVGQPTGAIWHRDGMDRQQWAGRSNADLRVWRPQNRIVAAIAGVYGSHTYNSASHLSLTDRESLANLLRPPFAIARLDGEQLWQGVRRPRLSKAAVYTPMLLDGRDLMPFACTHDRAEDTGFLGLLSAIEPNAIYANVPLLMGHRQAEHRGRVALAQRGMLLSLNNLAGYLGQMWAAAIVATDRSTRLQHVGRMAADLAREADHGIAAVIVDWKAKNAAMLVAGYDDARRAAGAGAPREWLDFLTGAERAALADAATWPDAVTVERLRRTLRQIAELSEHWPSLWTAMRDGLAAEWRGRCGLRAP